MVCGWADPGWTVYRKREVWLGTSTCLGAYAFVDVTNWMFVKRSLTVGFLGYRMHAVTGCRPTS